MLMAMAETVALRGTCSRLQVGAVVSMDGRVLSSGYNGAPGGFSHCDHSPTESVPCAQAVHAEANAIVFAARHGVATGGAVLHTTHLPCPACAKLIINAGIWRVVWKVPFRDDSGLELLTRGGVDWNHHPGAG
jgi:dCMP deaminase